MRRALLMLMFTNITCYLNAANTKKQKKFFEKMNVDYHKANKMIDKINTVSHPIYNNDRCESLKEEVANSTTHTSEYDVYQHTKSKEKKRPRAPPLWSWQCVERRCVRTALEPAHRPPPTAQPWLTCVMRCEPSPLWPQPTVRHAHTPTVVTLRDPPYHFNVTHSPSAAVTDYLHQAFQLFNQDVRKAMTATATATNDVLTGGRGRPLVVKIKVTSDPDPHLRLDTVEEYKLLVYEDNGTSVASVAAVSFCGARHALETLSQLLWFDEYVGGVVTFNSTYVHDRPRFPYRGLMLDTARNYFPVEDLLVTLDAMAANKLNTFHWHVTDSQSFPLRLQCAPQFAWHGAYSAREVYTAADVRAVVRRARLRGIRVLLEVDGPAHVGRAWRWVEAVGLRPLAVRVEAQPWRRYCGEPPCGQLDPRNPLVFELLEQMFAEILQLTGVRDVFHLGGDEVNREAWGPLGDSRALWRQYVTGAAAALQRANGGHLPNVTILWSSQFTQLYANRNILQQFVIQVWHSARAWGTAPGELRKGVIHSNVDRWYLDCGFGAWRSDEAGQCAYNSERRVYGHRPWLAPAEAGADGADGEEPEAVPVERGALGGEACLWTETVGRGALGGRLWARGAALAERLWADPARALDLRTRLRLDAQRRRLAARGARPLPLWSRWCSDNPYECDASGYK